MSEQQSNKGGVKSDEQKRATSHREYNEMPGSGQKAGPFGKHTPDRKSDKDSSLGADGGRTAQRKKQWSEMERSEDV